MANQTALLRSRMAVYLVVANFLRWLSDQRRETTRDEYTTVTEDLVVAKRITYATQKRCDRAGYYQNGVPSITPCVNGKVRNWLREEVMCEACGGSGVMEVREVAYRVVDDHEALVLAAMDIDAAQIRAERTQAMRFVRACNQTETAKEVIS